MNAQDELIMIKVEREIFSPEFYRRDFADMKTAADFLNLPVAEFTSFFRDELEMPLRRFLLEMRIEDVKEHLCRTNLHEPLHQLALLYGFRSRLHLLWWFFKCEKCLPRTWVYRQGVDLSWEEPRNTHHDEKSL